MTIYLLSAGGDLDVTFPWSINGACASNESETQVALAWSTCMAGIFGDATLKTFIPTGTSLSFTSVSTAGPELKQTTKTTTTQSVVGTSTGTAIGFRPATIISLRTAMATRWGRGRWFFPGLASNALATGGWFWSAAAMTALSNAVTSQLTTFNAAATLVIAHRKVISGGPAQFTTTPVLGGNVSDQIATQRRRADKRLPLRTNWTL